MVSHKWPEARLQLMYAESQPDSVDDVYLATSLTAKTIPAPAPCGEKGFAVGRDKYAVHNRALIALHWHMRRQAERNALDDAAEKVEG